jgi:threonine dehydrogenase-like Zn-dependent dehydrogenase
MAAAQKKVRVSFSYGYSVDDFSFVTRMMADERLSVDNLITDRVTLEEVPGVFEQLMQPNGHCKILIQPDI